MGQIPETLEGKWVFGKVNWGKFSRVCERKLLQVQSHLSVEIMTRKISQCILSAAGEAIPKTTGKARRRDVPWWNDEYQLVVGERNGAFKLVKRSHNFQHLIDYKRAQARVRSTIRTKRTYWRGFCSTLGSNTQLGEVWGMIRKMGGDRRGWSYQFLKRIVE